jgi:hypothetical protein
MEVEGDENTNGGRAQQWMEQRRNDGDEGKAMGGKQEGIKAKGTEQPSGSIKPSTLKHNQAQPSEVHQPLNPETETEKSPGWGFPHETLDEPETCKRK